MTTAIYLLQSPEGKSYIGRTINLESRLEQYRYQTPSGRSNPYLSSDIKKFGFESFTVSILESFEEGTLSDHLDERERYWINFLNTSYPMGYNLTKGGRENTTFLRERKGQRVELKNKQGITVKTYTSFNSCRKDLGMNKWDIKDGKEVQGGLVISIPNYDPSLNHQFTHTPTPVDCWDVPSQSFLQSYSSINRASMETGVAVSYISGILKGRFKTCRNYTFVREGETPDFQAIEKSSTSRPIMVYYVDRGEVKGYPNMMECVGGEKIVGSTLRKYLKSGDLFEDNRFFFYTNQYTPELLQSRLQDYMVIAHPYTQPGTGLKDFYERNKFELDVENYKSFRNYFLEYKNEKRESIYGLTFKLGSKV